MIKMIRRIAVSVLIVILALVMILVIVLYTRRMISVNRDSQAEYYDVEKRAKEIGRRGP